MTSDCVPHQVRQAGAEGDLVALFLHDNYARANKQSGAWMSSFVDQTRNWNTYQYSAPDEGRNQRSSETRNWNTYQYSAPSDAACSIAIHASGVSSTSRIPIIINNNNFAKSEPCLLSFDDAITLFHEMGHGLHGMLSSVTYSRLAGTNVLRDFVELPSQLLEHWLRSTDVVLRSHAAHCETGEPIPSAMLKRLNDARNFNQVLHALWPL